MGFFISTRNFGVRETYRRKGACEVHLFDRKIPFGTNAKYFLKGIYYQAGKTLRKIPHYLKPSSLSAGLSLSPQAAVIRNDLALRSPALKNAFNLSIYSVGEKGTKLDLKSDHPIIFEAAYEKICKLFREHFPNARLSEPGALGTIDSHEFAEGPNIGIMHADLRGILIAGYGQRHFKDANFVIFPPAPHNLFIQGDRVFVQNGIVLKWSGPKRLEIRYAGFSRPIEIDFLLCFGSLAEERKDFVGKGIPLLNSHFAAELSKDKARFKQLLRGHGLNAPRERLIKKEDGLTVDRIKSRIEDFLAVSKAAGFVIKPNEGWGGKRVRMFKPNEIERAAAFAADSFKTTETLLLEERIESLPFYIDGERIDWNIRVLLSDIGKGWSPHGVSEVRYKPYGEFPVNKHAGAKIMELKEAMKRLGLNSSQKKKLTRQIKNISAAIKDSIHRQLLTEHHGNEIADRTGHSYFRPMFLGLDLIVNENLEVFCIEINTGWVGGIESLADIRRDQGKYLAIKDITRKAYEAAKKNRQAVKTQKGTVSGRRQYLASAMGWHELGTLYLEKEHFEKAIECFQEVLKIDANNFDALHNLGVTLSRRKQEGDLDKAVELILKALEIYPEFLVAWRNLGWIYALKGDFEQAVKCCRRALEMDKRSAESWYMLGYIYGEKKQGKNIDRAIRFYQKALELEPDHIRALVNLSKIFDEKGDTERAIECCQKALRIDPENALAWTNLGVAYLEKRNIALAIEYSQKAIEIDPECIIAWNNLAIAYSREGDLDKAIRHGLTALELDPDDPVTINNLKMFFFQKRDFGMAIKFSKKSLEIEPDNLKALVVLAASYISTGNADSAVTHLTRALKIDPRRIESWRLLALSHIQKGKADLAVKYCQKALRIDPEDTMSLGLMGKAYAQKLNFALAIEYLNKALAINPRQAQIWDELTRAYSAKGDTSKAIECCKKGLKFLPQNPTLLRTLEDLETRRFNNAA